MDQCDFFVTLYPASLRILNIWKRLLFIFERHWSENSMGKEKARKVCGFCLFIVSLAAV